MAFPLGWTYETDTNYRNGQYFYIGRVTSIILNPSDEGYTSPADIGKIYYQLLYSPLGKSKTKRASDSGNRPAYPISGFLKNYPLIGEIVLIMTGPSKNLNDGYNNQELFYFPPYSVWNDSNHNAFPDLQDYLTFLNESTNKPEYSGGGVTGSSLPLGDTFKEKYVRNLRPFEGDVILQSRFGQSIRFGSTNIRPQYPNSKDNVEALNTWSTSQGSNPNSTNGDPITIIVNEQGPRTELGKFDTFIEDIKKDGSSIYMSSTQILDFSFTAGFPFESLNQSVTIPSIASIQNEVSTRKTSAASQDQSINR